VINPNYLDIILAKSKKIIIIRCTLNPVRMRTGKTDRTMKFDAQSLITTRQAGHGRLTGSYVHCPVRQRTMILAMAIFAYRPAGNLAGLSMR
jgi:hypothetical protein